MNPTLISSVALPGLDFMDSLAETLAEYGVEPSQVFDLPPGIVNFISYLLADTAELEEAVFRTGTECTRHDRILKHIRSQRNGLVATLRALRDRDETRITVRA